jgi:hypothetical protein
MIKIRRIQTSIDDLHWHPTFSAVTYVLQRRNYIKHTITRCVLNIYIKEHTKIMNYMVKD